jgi:hypothetical protein
MVSDAGSDNASADDYYVSCAQLFSLRSLRPLRLICIQPQTHSVTMLICFAIFCSADLASSAVKFLFYERPLPSNKEKQRYTKEVRCESWGALFLRQFT